MKHHKKNMSEKGIQKVFSSVLKESKEHLKKLKPNVPKNSPLFEYYVGVEVSLNVIGYKTFNCSKKDDMKEQMLFSFDPKHRKFENMPQAVVDLGAFLDLACTK
jgi:hypothetical protein